MPPNLRNLLPLFLFLVSLAPAVSAPAEIQVWLDTPQHWRRDTDGPILSLGEPGTFDDTHIFAPMVAVEDGRYRLWHCGSTGSVAERVFRMGLSISDDGRRFTRHPENPVYELSGARSVLTPTLLRTPAGLPLRENGSLRMWFSTTSFTDKSGLHTLHEASSEDGVSWAPASPALMKNVYAPTILKTGRHYQIWHTDVSTTPWTIRHASSMDGRKWRLTPYPVLELDQDWEKGNLFYPTVIQKGGVYLMWYGAYWTGRPNTTALGFAASIDGLQWHKHPGNPVFEPDPSRPWESHYTTSQSIMQLPDGSLRMWYASRKKPPFRNKYFAINTAVWKNPEPKPARLAAAPIESLPAFRAWQSETRTKLNAALGIPSKRAPLAPEKRGEIERDGVVIEKWVFTSEPGSRIPAVLYRPAERPADSRMPAIVLTFGHGGSKSQWQYNFAGQLYARMGLACLAMDPLGEEERHAKGRLGTRAHDPRSVSERAEKAGRLIMGKLVFDTMRGIDFLETREDIDHDKIGVAGNSLGGAVAGWMAALEPRIKMALVCGWAYHDISLRTKFCTMLPNQRMRQLLGWGEYASLAAPDCAVMIMNGDADWVIDREDDKSAWTGTDRAVKQAGRTYEAFDAGGQVRAWYEADGGHRPYFAYKDALEWIHRQLGTPAMSLDRIRELPTLNSGDYCDRNGIRLERLYGTPLHQRGATLPDVGIRPIPPGEMAALRPDELGSAGFTVAGWLNSLDARGPAN